MKLFETYNISISKIRKTDGSTINYAFIDPKKSTDDTFAIKDEIKNYGAAWNTKDRVWGWYLSSDPIKLQAQLNKFVYPAIEFLNSKETVPQGQAPRTADAMKDEFNQLLSQMDDVLTSPMSVPEATIPFMDEKTVRDKLKQFKDELVSIMSSEDFIAKLEPIIKFRNAQGHQLSFLNSLLIWIQDPKATMCKSKNTWESVYKRKLKPNAPALCVSVPQNNRTTIFATKEQKAEFTKEFLAKLNKTGLEDLTPGERDIYNVELKKLNRTVNVTFKYAYTYYDVRFTENMTDEDLVGNYDTENIPWTDETSEPTELTEKIYDAMLQIIPEAGIQLNFVDDLGGAKGVSKSGRIDVLKNTPKNAGAASTLIHEFSRELLHQRYLQKAENNSDWSKFFVGTERGRGVVEQQAEMSAYLVMRFFGIKIQENINYIGIWGADANKAANVFDTVASVADTITKKIAEKIGANKINESMDSPNITGMDVAALLGPKGIEAYKRSKAQDEEMNNTLINEEKETFWNFFNRINIRF